MFRHLVIILVVIGLSGAAAVAQDLEPTAVPTPPWFSLNSRIAQYGDFNGNGIVDMVTVALGGNANRVVFVADPGPNFAGQLQSEATIMDAGNIPGTLLFGTNLEVGDFDGDGNLDVLIDVNVGGALRFWLASGDGLGGFATPVAVTPSIQAVSTRVGDFNGDGRMDLAVLAQTFLFDVEIWLSQAGQWAQIYAGPPLLSSDISAEVGDLDGNGCDDILYASTTNIGSAEVVLGATAGAFTAQSVTLLAGGAGARLGRSGDYDGDGRIDVAFTTDTPPHDAWIAFGTPTAGVVPTNLGPLPAHPAGSTADAPTLHPADMDADGRTDLLVNWVDTNTPWRTYASILRQRPDGSLSPNAFRAWDSPNDVLTQFSVEDFDADGDMDVVGLSSTQTGTAEVYHLVNRAIYGAGCPGITGVPNIDVGSAHLGNQQFELTLSNAAATAPVALMISASPSMASGCGIMVDIGPDLFVPSGATGYANTDAAGEVTFTAPLPSTLQVAGFQIWAQFAIGDAAGGTSFGGAPIALTPGRGITLF